jgi:hypothetical protein
VNRTTFSAALLGAILVVFAVHSLDFHGSVPNFRKESGGGVLLDIRPAFSESAIYARLDGYGERGRKNYIFRNLTVDVLLPLSVFPFLFLLMRHANGRLRATGVHRYLLPSFAFAYVVFDLAENASVVALLVNYPQRLAFVAAVLPYLTVIKRSASLLAIAVPLMMLAVARLRGARLDGSSRPGPRA